MDPAASTTFGGLALPSPAPHPRQQTANCRETDSGSRIC
jgi:hypothetical protein